MTQNNKKYFLIFILAILTIGTIFFLSKKDSSTETPVTAEDNLFPETSITHGHGLAVDIEDSNKLYIATHHGLLLLKNEKELYRIGKNKDDYMGFSPHPKEAGVFFSSGHPQKGGNIGFQKSKNYGVTWQKISNGINGPVDFHAMALSPVNPNLVYGWFKGNLQKSTDMGMTWTIANKDVLTVLLVPDTVNENTLYAATPQGQGIIVSNDQGSTWRPLSPALSGGAVATLAVHPQNSKILLTFSEALQGMGKSVDGGITWKKIDETWNNETVLHIAFDKKTPDTVYALTHQNKIYKSNDTGETWTKIW